MENTITQKQRLDEYQKLIYKSILDDKGKLKHWFVCQLDGMLEMIDLPIGEFDEDYENWENGECLLVMYMIVTSINKKYLESLTKK